MGSVSHESSLESYDHQVAEKGIPDVTVPPARTSRPSPEADSEDYFTIEVRVLYFKRYHGFREIFIEAPEYECYRESQDLLDLEELDLFAGKFVMDVMSSQIVLAFLREKRTECSRLTNVLPAVDGELIPLGRRNTVFCSVENEAKVRQSVSRWCEANRRFNSVRFECTLLMTLSAGGVSARCCEDTLRHYGRPVNSQ